jgi:hypothetical protein
MHAVTAWALLFQVCLGHTFTPATLVTVVDALATLGDAIQIEMIHLCHIAQGGQGKHSQLTA